MPPDSWAGPERVVEENRPIGKALIAPPFLGQAPPQRFTAVIDTGAIHSVIGGIVLQRLRLRASGSREFGVLGGHQIRAGRAWVSIGISDGPWQEVQASVVPHIAPGIDALIGMDYLSNLRLTVWGGRFNVSEC